MICYRDMTFCNSAAHRPECSRQLTDEVRAAAVKWWGGPDAPIAAAPLCDHEKEDPQ